MENVANSTAGELVYAYDEEGKEVAVGLLISGSFNPIDEGENNPNNPWIAAQEECASNEAGPALTTEMVKTEKADDLDGYTDSAKLPGDKKKKQSSVIKTYKSRSNLKKTLRQIRMQIQQKQKKNVQKIAQRKMVPNNIKIAISKRIGKGRKRILDRVYKSPHFVRKQKFEK